MSTNKTNLIIVRDVKKWDISSHAIQRCIERNIVDSTKDPKELVKDVLKRGVMTIFRFGKVYHAYSHSFKIILVLNTERRVVITVYKADENKQLIGEFKYCQKSKILYM